MRSVALEKAFQTMCLDQSFVIGQNPSISAKSKAIALRFLLKMRCFGTIFESL